MINIPIQGRPGEFTTEPVPNPPPPTIRRAGYGAEWLPFAIGWTASREDKWGTTGFQLNTRFNFSGLFNNKNDFQPPATSGKADGNFVILRPALSREQKIYGDWGVRLSADGQWANQPLMVGLEQFSLGGLAGVRGYRDAQEFGDTGWRVLLEPHTPLFKVALGENGTLATFVRASIFTDYGQRFLLDPPAGLPRSVAMWGAGFALNLDRGEHFEARLTFGVPLLDVPGVHAWNPRLFFSVGVKF